MTLLLRLIVASLIFLQGAYAFCADGGKETLADALLRYDLVLPGGEEFIVKKRFERAGTSMRFENITAEAKASRIELEITTPLEATAASSAISSKMGAIERLYGPQFTPYQGAVTNVTSCSAANRPVKRAIQLLGASAEVILANASDRFVMGVCDPKLIKMRTAIVFGFDQASRRLFEIRLFRPSSSFSEKAVLRLLSGIRKRQ